jgi:hypothetical protein
MPDALRSLAVMPVVLGLLFMFQAIGLALTEVVVAGLERGSARALWRFTKLLASVSTSVLLLIALTPLARVWFGTISGLDVQLTELAGFALILGVPIATTRVLQSWYAGVLVHARATRPISEAVVLFLLVAIAVFAAGIITQRWTAVNVAIVAYTLGRVVQTAWVWLRSREQVAEVLR